MVVANTYYCVLNIRSGEQNYAGTSEVSAADALVPGTVYGKGGSPTAATGQAMARRDFQLKCQKVQG